MFLCDFEEAIAAIKKFFPYTCWNSVKCSLFGSSFIFEMFDSDWYVVYYRESGKIIKQFSDTWKNPDHKEVIYDGTY